MGKLRGFLEYDRIDEANIAVEDRVKNYKEFTVHPGEEKLQDQGARCMDCGVPFCHSGCPLGNMIPDFNDAVYQNDWKKALRILHATNNFPEFTGRLCPAPCEAACVLGIINPPVSIEMIEKYIVERGFKEGWIQANPPKNRTGKTIAVVGSGPAGLAAAQQLNRAGHNVTVFERDEKVGGLLRYGIPDFKMEKHIIDRRVSILEEEGIVIKTGVEVGKNYSVEKLENFDAVILCGGATVRKMLPIPGSDAKGVVQAMDFLPKSNRWVDGLTEIDPVLHAQGKNVIVIGGGDTGSDCIGTSNRQGAASVTNFEIMPRPADDRTDEHPWPYWPFKHKTSSSHEEGSEREFSIMTKEFVTDNEGRLSGLKTVQVRWEKQEGERPKLVEEPNSEKEWPCDLALLALGFTGPEPTLAEQLGIQLDERSNINADTKSYQTNIPHIFAAGDMRRGQSLIVWAISEGREAAYQVDQFLMGTTQLPTKTHGDLPNHP